MNKKMIILIRIIPLLGILLLSSSSKTKKKVKTPFPVDSLILYMKEIGIKHIDIVLRQAKLETYYFSSPIFRDNHNLFGMRLAKNRKTTAVGESETYAVYTDWRSSVKDYYLWQIRTPKMLDRYKDNYYAFLKIRHYSTKDRYYRVLKKVPLTKSEIELIKKLKTKKNAYKNKIK